jgi:hypothetical protein
MTSRRLSFTTVEKQFFQKLAPTTSKAVDCLLAWFTEAKIGHEKLLGSIEELKRHAPEGEPEGAPRYKPNQATRQLLGEMQTLAPGLSLNVLIRALVRLKMAEEEAVAPAQTEHTENQPKTDLGPSASETVTTAVNFSVADGEQAKGSRNLFLMVFLICMITNFPLLLLAITKPEKFVEKRAESGWKMKLEEVEKEKMFAVAQLEEERQKRRFLEDELLSAQKKLMETNVEAIKLRSFSEAARKHSNLIPLNVRKMINAEYIRLSEQAASP